MTTLIRNDLRLLRPLLWAIAATVALLYGGLPVAVAVTRHFKQDITATPDALMVGWGFASLLFFLATPLFCTAAGAMAFALERRERWAEWTALLPVRRRTLVGSRLLVRVSLCGGVLALPFVAVGGLVALQWAFVELTDEVAPLEWAETWDAFWNHGLGPTIALLTGAAVGLFGVAWLLSAAVRSPVLAAVLAIALAGGPVVWRLGDILLPAQPADVRDDRVDLVGRRIVDPDPAAEFRTATLHLAAAVAGVGLVALAAGGVVQCRRVSP